MPPRRVVAPLAISAALGAGAVAGFLLNSPATSGAQTTTTPPSAQAPSTPAPSTPAPSTPAPDAGRNHTCPHRDGTSPGGSGGSGGSSAGNTALPPGGQPPV